MKKATTYNPQKEAITNFYEEENPMCHEVDFCYSYKSGYYLARRVTQVWRQRSWETLTLSEEEDLFKRVVKKGDGFRLPPDCRYLETYRQLDHDALLRCLVDLAIPDHGDLRERFHTALDAAGIKKSA